MAIDTPIDAWYVWIGVVLVSGVLVGIVLELPTEPPPDATELANTAEYVTATGSGATATVEPAADELRTDGTTIELRRGEVVSRETVRMGTLVPVAAAETPREKSLLASLIDEPTAQSTYPQSVIERSLSRLSSRPGQLNEEWISIDGTVQLRAVTVDERTVVLIGTESGE